MNEYIKVIGFQMNLELASNFKKEYMISSRNYINQLEKTFFLINNLLPDIAIYPEMNYLDKYERIFKKLSRNRLIVSGSIYRDQCNCTVIFQDGHKIEIPKLCASGSEPMTRYIDYKKPEELLEEIKKTHIFEIKRKKIIILNCMEYYHLAYFLAREQKELFAFVSPCSNNNPHVFKEESKALHNHNENIYSFVVNCLSNYNGKKYGKGESYIYGPIQTHEKEWLQQEGINTDEHQSSILNLQNEESYFYGEFMNNLVSYGRSDNYLNNPRNILVRKL